MRESILNPFYGISLNGDDIIPNRAGIFHPMCQPVIICNLTDLALFGISHGSRGITIPNAAPVFHLYKHQISLMNPDQIDLTAAIAVIAPLFFSFSRKF